MTQTILVTVHSLPELMLVSARVHCSWFRSGLIVPALLVLTQYSSCPAFGGVNHAESMASSEFTTRNAWLATHSVGCCSPHSEAGACFTCFSKVQRAHPALADQPRLKR